MTTTMERAVGHQQTNEPVAVEMVITGRVDRRAAEDHESAWAAIGWGFSSRSPAI